MRPVLPLSPERRNISGVRQGLQSALCVLTNDILRENPMIKKSGLAISLLLASYAGSATADDPAVFRDIQTLHAKKLSKAEAEKLLTGAKISRKVISTGSTNFWTNEPDGKLIASSDNRGRIGTSTLMSSVTAPGTWHISPEGRYCVTIEWKGIPTEKWCRFVFETSTGYYTSKTDHNGTEKVYHLIINDK